MMTREEKLKAVAENDTNYDGKFYYAVKSTGIYCRPSCKSKKAKAENIEFFETGEEAEKSGYRPCKRCRPDLIDYQPVLEIAEKMKCLIDNGFLEKEQIFSDLKKIGVTPNRAIQIFKEKYETTPGEYADSLRIREACFRLAETETPVVEIAYALGFESIPAFYAFFQKHMKETPAAYRRNKKNPSQSQTNGITSFIYDTVLGKATISCNGDAITAVRLGAYEVPAEYRRTELTGHAATQLDEYFTGQRRSFDVPLCPEGTPFQKSVWAILQTIPYGETRSYKQVAEMIGKPSASRAVGMANNKNPILIMIPCHRVVGSDGSLVGYAAGLKVKERLLLLEKENINRQEKSTCSIE